MPRKTPNAFLKVFDKIFAVVVAIGLLLAIYSVATKSKVKEEQDPRKQIERYVQMIKQKLEKPAEAFAQVRYADEVKKFWQEVPEPIETIRRWIFHRPRPVIYDQAVLIGLDKRKVITFAKPLDQGSVRVQPEFRASARHPIPGRPLNEVEVTTFNNPGFFLVSGNEGAREHKMPCLCGPDIDRVVQPPIEFSAEVSRGEVVVSWNSNPENKRGKLQVVEYYLYRKRLRDVIADFVQIGAVTAKEAPAGTTPGAPGGPTTGGGFQPQPRQPRGAAAKPGAEEPKEKVKEYTFVDKDVEPDETYLYKVSTKARFSFPDESEFTPLVQATTPPDVDFQFLGGTAMSARFTVYKFQGGQVYKHDFRISVGDEIGGIVEDKNANKQLDLRTQYTLLDFQKLYGPIYDQKTAEVKPREGQTYRIVYQDKNGNGRMRWRNQMLAKELIAQTRERTERPGTRGGPSGFDVLRPN